MLLEVLFTTVMQAYFKKAINDEIIMHVLRKDGGSPSFSVGMIHYILENT